jgi:hypothetical protein
MKDSSVYENRLSRVCAGLDDSAVLMYRVVGGQLCDADTINMLENYGFAFIQVGACGLNNFTPIDRSVADALLTKDKVR